MSIVFKKIFQEGLQRRPFKAHKRYEVTNVNYSSSFGIQVLRAINPNDTKVEISSSVNGSIATDPNTHFNTNAWGSMTQVSQEVLWSSLNQVFFQESDKHLYDTASVMSIPINKFGDGIKPGSVFITDNSHYPSASIKLVDQSIDDSYGLLIANELTSSLKINESNTILKFSFDSTRVTDSSNFQNEIISDSSIISPIGVGGTGYAYVFGGQSQSILVRHNSNFDVFNKNDDWAVSFWASLPPSQSGAETEKLIVSKYIAERYINEDGTITTQNSEVGSYPFKIGVYTSYSDVNGKVFFETSDGNTITRITSSAQYNDGSYRQYSFNKTGSLYEIWVNGSRIASQSVSYGFNINNQKDVLIGNDSYGGASGFSGSIDEFRLHRTTLTPSEVSSLADNNVVSGSYLQKNDVGYVFYKQGMIVVTDPRPRYQNVLLGDGDGSYTNKNYQVDYRSTKVVEEVVALCEIGKEEFLVTTNPSARYSTSESEVQLAEFTTSSAFYPYVTTIGLYNDSGELLATAKLGSPLKRRSDVDVTIQIKFDID
jgi:hypothetical protein